MPTSTLPLLMILALGAPKAAPSDLENPFSSDSHGSHSAHPSGKKVTIDAKTPNQALRQIATAAGWGLALNTGPAGDASVEFSFKKVPVEEAFAAVVSASHLRATRIGDSIVVTAGGATSAANQADADSADSDSAKDSDDASDDDEDQQAAQDILNAASDAGSHLDGGLASTSHLKIDKNGFKYHKAHHHSNGNDRVQIGQNIDIPAGAQVGDVVAIGGSIHLGAGASVGDAVAIGGSIETESGTQVTGDAVSVGGSVHLGPGTHVAGDSVTLGGVLEVDPGATIQGQQVNLGVGRLFAFGIPAAFAGGLTILFLVSKLAQFVLFFCLGALLLLAAPTHLANIEASLVRQPIRAGLAGFLATLAIPVLTLLLIITLVGIPLVAVEIFGIALAALMGFTALSVFIGRRIQIPVRGGGLLGLAVGTAIVVALSALPWIGGVFLVTIWFVAFGAALVTRFGSVAQP